MLARWRQDQNVLVSLPAAQVRLVGLWGIIMARVDHLDLLFFSQALANLDQDYGVHQFQSGVYLLLPTDRHVQHKNIRSNRLL